MKQQDRKISLIVHGGAGADSELIKNNIDEYKRGLQSALDAGYKILETGGNAIDAVEAAVIVLEDHPLFNAGRGAELNRKGGVEMCASIMDGSNMKSGAAAIVKNVKNPVKLARAIMDHSEHIYLGSEGAMEFGKEHGIEFRDESYFIAQHAIDVYEEMKKKQQEEKKKVKSHGTVGAVACDIRGNIAACTSTGGTEFEHEGRIGDSSMVGIGVYANNNTCAVSTTGQGEDLIRNVVSHHLHSLVEMASMRVDRAAEYLIHEKLKDVEGDMGLIAVDRNGTICMQFNSERMHRAWRSSDGAAGVEIY